MAFPETILPIKVEIAPAGTFIDITSYVYLDDIVIDRGTPDESKISKPTSCSMRINNIDGRFSPRNPNGPYYGSIGRNTPILVSVSDGDRYLDVPGSGHAQTVDSAQVSITGDIDVRMDATLRDWSGQDALGSEIDLIGKMQFGAGQASWLVSIFLTGHIIWRWSADGTNLLTSVSTERPIPDPGGRLAIRVTHDVNDGAGNNVVTFYTGPTIDGPWQQLGDPVTTAGTTSLFDSTAALKVGDASNFNLEIPYGKIWAAKVFNGISGTVAADINFRIQDDGDTSFTGADGLTWTTSGAATINNQYNRFRGEVVAWPARWTTGGFDAWVPLQAESLRRRLGQGRDPLKSALTRKIPSDPLVLGYWPWEDGEDTTRFASGLPGGTPMAFTGSVDTAAHPGPAGSDDLPSLGEGCSWLAPVPGPSSVTGEFQVEWIVNIQQSSATYRTIMRFKTNGTAKTINFFINNTGAQMTGTDATGATVFSQTTLLTQSEMINQWVRWKFYATQNGGNVDWTMTWIPILGEGGSVSNSYAGTVGAITAVSGPPNLHADIDGLAQGHVAVFSGSTTAFNDADHGFTGETAWSRLERLADEEDIGMRVVGVDALTEPMGAQRPDGLLDLLDECATADHAILGDTRDWADSTAFKFIARHALHNQPVRLLLGYEDDGEVHAPLDPTDDDQYTRNRVTATRERGSSAIAEVADGPLGIDRIGPYGTEIEVNIESDDRLADHAGWEAHLGTWDEERYPTVLVRVQAAPHLMNQVMEVDQGSRLRITDARESSTVRAWIPPGDIDLQVRGYTERLSQFQWEIEYQCIPARPYDVNAIDHLNQQTNRLDTDGTELAEALDTTETAVEVFTTAGPTWTDDVENLPFDWMAGGEALTVAAPGSLINANPFFTTDTTGWTVDDSTIARSTVQVHPDPLAVASLLVTPNGAGAIVGASVARTATGSINPGARYITSMWVYSTLAHTDFHMRADWLTSADGAISSSVGSAVSVAAGVWTFIEQEFTAPATASKADLFIQQGGTPASTKTWYAWAARINRAKASLIYDEFGRTDTDTWTNADSSQTWTNTGTAADYDVLSGYGRHINPAASVAHESTIANTEADSDLYVDVTTAATPTGASLFAGPIARFADTNNLYQARLEISTASVITLSIRKRVASVETELDTFTHWRAHVAGTFVRVRFQVIGTALKAKAWRVGDPEPDVWQCEVTDSALSAAGSVGCRSVRNAGNTNANAEFRFDNFELANPQVYSVVRSANDVVKSHSSGAAVVLRYPMILAL